MVDFNFDLKSLFKQHIVKVKSDLLPQSFHGNRYQVADTRSKICQIINDLGELSAVSQKLNKAITTHQKLGRMDDQTVYLLADPSSKPKGVAIGMLKVGRKDLFVFDEDGQLRQVTSSPCILDFYIHEKHQRSGYGKMLFDAMLREEKWDPVKCSIDRPSEKMIGFMKKHYGLERAIPQSNNFVLFEGYFDKNIRQERDIINEENIQSCGVQYIARNTADYPKYHDTADRAIVKRFETHVPVYSMAEIMRKSK